MFPSPSPSAASAEEWNRPPLDSDDDLPAVLAICHSPPTPSRPGSALSPPATAEGAADMHGAAAALPSRNNAMGHTAAAAPLSYMGTAAAPPRSSADAWRSDAAAAGQATGGGTVSAPTLPYSNNNHATAATPLPPADARLPDVFAAGQAAEGSAADTPASQRSDQRRATSAAGPLAPHTNAQDAAVEGKTATDDAAAAPTSPSSTQKHTAASALVPLSSPADAATIGKAGTDDTAATLAPSSRGTAATGNARPATDGAAAACQPQAEARAGRQGVSQRRGAPPPPPSRSARKPFVPAKHGQPPRTGTSPGAKASPHVLPQPCSHPSPRPSSTRRAWRCTPSPSVPHGPQPRSHQPRLASPVSFASSTPVWSRGPLVVPAFRPRSSSHRVACLVCCCSCYSS